MTSHIIYIYMYHYMYIYIYDVFVIAGDLV